MTTTYWVDNLNPVLLPLWGDFAIRYYGLAYLLGFVGGYWLLKYLGQKKKTAMNPEQQESYILAMVIGILLGGRLGYMLLYTPAAWLQDPLKFFRVWEGGMASHGGFVGVILVCWLLSYRFKLPFKHLGDIVCAISPLGLMLGRLANFINGELWGKVSYVPWAVIFPQSMPPGTPWAAIPPRHPSQLYEAALEGLLLLGYTQWRIWKNDTLKHPGQLSGEFLLLYALVRIFCEQFREPDASLLFGLSRGIFYSLFLAGFGIFLIWQSRRSVRPAA